MQSNPQPWVQEDVRALYEQLAISDYRYSDDVRACQCRLVTDLRMKDVYESAYLNKRLTPQGWKNWFAIASGIDNRGLSDVRERFKKHAELISELASHMQEVARLTEEIDELAAAEANRPIELYDPFELLEAAAAQKNGHANHLPSLFKDHVKPPLDTLRHFEIGRYVPSVTQILGTLSEIISNYEYELEDTGARSAYPEINAALASRQSAKLPEYIRCFDEAISWYEADTGGSGFLVPAEIMAVQAAVALNLGEVDKKQVTSARLTIKNKQ